MKLVIMEFNAEMQKPFQCHFLGNTSSSCLLRRHRRSLLQQPSLCNQPPFISHDMPPSPIYFLSARAQLSLAAASTGSQARNPPALCAAVNFSGRVSLIWNRCWHSSTFTAACRGAASNGRYNKLSVATEAVGKRQVGLVILRRLG